MAFGQISVAAALVNELPPPADFTVLRLDTLNMFFGTALHMMPFVFIFECIDMMPFVFIFECIDSKSRPA
eukprot:4416174-Amphidinium_carterae.1